jgi:hypothetical protein
MARALRHVVKIEQAMGAYERAIGISPDLTVLHWDLSHLFLLTGNFEADRKEFDIVSLNMICLPRSRGGVLQRYEKVVIPK